ncbi:ABC transporter permease [Oscillospiraceae bacterium PP1C4]
MKSYRTLAWKELSAQKVTSILILIAMIFSTLTTTVIGQSLGILSAMREQQAITIGGNRYATFVQMNDEQAKSLKNDPRISYAGRSIGLGTVELNRSLTLGLTEYCGDSLNVYPSYTHMKQGRLPEKAMEIALPEDVLQFLGFTGVVGDLITLSASKALRHGIEISSFDYTDEFILTGITESNYLGYTAGSVQGIVGEGTAEEILPNAYTYYNVDIRTAEKRTFQSTMDDLTQKLQVHELDTMYNTPYLNAMGISYNAEAADITSDDGFPFMLAAGILVGTLILIAAGLVIYNILKIAVSRRIKHYGTLRAIGGEKKQLYSIVVVEVLILCIIGIPIGLLVGVLLAKGILSAATSLLSPEIFMVQSTIQLNELIAENSSGKEIFLFASVAITLLFAIIAALPAARFVARVSPVVAMFGTNTKFKRRKRTVRKIRNFERYYARLNLKRNRGRTAITVLSLVMSITVFIALQGFVSLVNVAGGHEQEHLGDYSIVNESVGFSTDDFAKLEKNENVAAVAAMQFSLYMQNDEGKLDGISLGFDLQAGETFQVIGLNDIYWDDYFEDIVSHEQLMALKSGNGCVVRNPIPLTIEGKEIPRSDIQIGSTIALAEQELPVLKTLDNYDGYLSVGNSGFTNGIQVIVNNQLYSKLTGNDTYVEMFPILKDGADRVAFDAALKNLCQSIPGTTYISYEQTDQQLAESFAQINALCWGLILFIGLIGVLNIVNTVYTNIHTRISEIGIQRAVGQSRESLYKTFLWEGAYYGLIASFVGGILGYLCSVLIGAATNNALQFGNIPVVPILEAVIVSIIACLTASAIPLRSIAKADIVKSISSIE